MERLASVAAIVLACTVVAHAQAGLTGKWQGETGAGASLVLDLTAQGDTLTGTLTRNDQSTKLVDGKVTKNTFSFKATLNDRTEGFSGELKGDQIALWMDRQGPSNAVTLTRVKSK